MNNKAHRTKSLFTRSIVAVMLLMIGQVLAAQFLLGQSTTNVLREYRAETLNGKSLLVAIFDTMPDYEVFLQRKTGILTVKIRNATWPKSLATRTNFSLAAFRYATLNRLPTKELWIKLHTNIKNITYNVLPSGLKSGILAIEVASDDNWIEKNPYGTYLESIPIERNGDFENIIFQVSKPFSYEVQSQQLPQESYRITLKNVHLGFKPRDWWNNLQTVESLSFEQDGDDLVLDLLVQPHHQKREIVYDRALNQLVFKTQPFVEEISTTEEIRFVQSEQMGDSTNMSFWKNRYVVAENQFRQKQYAQSAANFEKIYRTIPNKELGVRAGFRWADSLHAMQQERPIRQNYTQVIQSYQEVIFAAEKLNLKPAALALAYANIGDNFFQDGFFEESLIYWNQLIQDFPKSIYSQKAEFMRAQIFYQNQDYPKAILYLRQFVQKYPHATHFSEAHLLLGLSYAALEQTPNALQHFQIATQSGLDIAQQAPNELYAMGNSYFIAQDYVLATQTFQTLFRQYPEYPKNLSVAVKLADYQRSKGERERALAIYNDLAKVPSWQQDPYFQMAIADHHSLGINEPDYQTAKDLYTQISQENKEPAIAEALLLKMAINHGMHQQPQQAIEELDKLFADFPESPLIANGSADAVLFENLEQLMFQAYLNENYNRVITYYLRYRQKLDRQKKLFVYRIVGVSYYKTGNQEESLRFFRYLEKNDTETRRGEDTFTIGESYFAVKQWSKATDYFRDVITRFPNSVFAAQAQLRLSNIERNQKQYEQAINRLQSAIEEHQNSGNPLIYNIIPEMWFELAQIQKELGRFEMAWQSYQEVAKSSKYALQDPKTPNFVRLAQFYAGDMLRELMSYDAALAQYQKTIERYPQNERATWSKYYMASILQEQKEYAAALTLYDELVQAPNDEVYPLLQQLARASKQEIETNAQYTQYLKGDS